MPWKETKVEDKRKMFIKFYLDDEASITSLCREFEVSRKTAYKWIERFKELGDEGLKDQRRARINQTQTDEELVQSILSVKNKRLTWGPKKIRGFLCNQTPEKEWPSATTIGTILLKNGFQKTRELRKRLPVRSKPFSACQESNDLWSMDFKGWFRTKEGVKCDPLTLTDAHSRFLLHCSKLPLGTTEYVWDILEKCFYQYGLPTYLRHDNGPPFAACGAGRLSRLSINIIKAGVIPEWIDPGKPYQNGRHERMHRTLKAEAIIPMALTLKEQQLKFSEFQNYFNFERPHESLGQKTPGSIYTYSPREWDGQLKSPEYDTSWQIIRVRGSGQIGWRGDEIFISKALENEHIGLRENQEGEWEAYYGPVYLGVIDQEGKLKYAQRETRSNLMYKDRVY